MASVIKAFSKRAFTAGLALLALTAFVDTRAYAEDRVRIGQATSALGFLPIWAARATDTFKPQNLDLQWAAINGGDPAALAALDTGDIDLAAVGSETALQAIAKKQPFQLVYSLMSTMSLQLVVSSDFLARTGVSASDPLAKRIAALKGATIGVSAVRGAQDRVARWLIAQGGLNPQQDLKIAMVGGPPAIRAALENKQIDGFVLSPPEGTLADAAGAGKILIRMGEEIPELKTLHFLVLVAKTPIEEPRRGLIVRTIKALQAANEATLKDPAKIASEIQTRFFAKVPVSAIISAVETMKPGISRGGRFTAEEAAYLLRFTADTGTNLEMQLDPAKTEGAFWTNAFIDAAGK